MDNPRLKILAIADQADNLTTLRAVMQDILPACTLVTALNGSSGLELALTEDPDVILLDIVMPDMDGYEVCRRLKADERVRSIPVVFLTALCTDRASRIQALESGAEGFLAKPLDEQELVAEVRAMAKLKAASLMQRDQNERLAVLVAERTRTLQESQLSLLNTLYEEDATLSPVHDAAGKLVNYVAAKRDVTNEAALEDQLRQAQKMEAIGHLAGGVAHDFNNMLQSVMGFAELALGRVPPDHPVREDLEEILCGARRAADLTKQLLTFARKQAIAPRVLDLNDAISTSLKMLRHLIGEDINLVWLPGAALWPVKMDPSQIDQLLANLCINARDAISGVGKITIETVNQSIDESYCFRQANAVPGDYVLFRVSDDGCGMAKEVQAHIFEPFFTTKGAGEGTGLGLAMVYGIVKQNRGFINVNSEPGKGTTFHIYLPRFLDEAAGKAKTATAPASLGGTETILLVDDEIGVRTILTRLLKHFGYTVLTAEGPEVALRMSAEHAGPIELLLTDVAMPGMNGRDLALKLAETRPTTKVLFISGYAATAIAKSDLSSSVAAFLSKPFTRDELARKVRDMLDAKPAPQA